MKTRDLERIVRPFEATNHRTLPHNVYNLLRFSFTDSAEIGNREFPKYGEKYGTITAATQIFREFGAQFVYFNPLELIVALPQNSKLFSLHAAILVSRGTAIVCRNGETRQIDCSLASCPRDEDVSDYIQWRQTIYMTEAFREAAAKNLRTKGVKDASARNSIVFASDITLIGPEVEKPAMLGYRCGKKVDKGEGKTRRAYGVVEFSVENLCNAL